MSVDTGREDTSFPPGATALSATLVAAVIGQFPRGGVAPDKAAADGALEPPYQGALFSVGAEALAQAATAADTVGAYPSARPVLRLAPGTPNTRFSTPPMNMPGPAPARTSSGKCAPRSDHHHRGPRPALAIQSGRTTHAGRRRSPAMREAAAHADGRPTASSAGPPPGWLCSPNPWKPPRAPDPAGQRRTRPSPCEGSHDTAEHGEPCGRLNRPGGGRGSIRVNRRPNRTIHAVERGWVFVACAPPDTIGNRHTRAPGCRGGQGFAQRCVIDHHLGAAQVPAQ
jgi:hypothetical protein